MASPCTCNPVHTSSELQCPASPALPNPVTVTLPLDHSCQPQTKLSPAPGPWPSSFSICPKCFLRSFHGWLPLFIQVRTHRPALQRALSRAVTFRVLTDTSPFWIFFRALITVWKHPAYLFVNFFLILPLPPTPHYENCAWCGVCVLSVFVEWVREWMNRFLIHRNGEHSAGTSSWFAFDLQL